MSTKHSQACDLTSRLAGWEHTRKAHCGSWQHARLWEHGMRQAIWDQTNSAKGGKEERKKEFSSSSIQLRDWELERPLKGLQTRKLTKMANFWHLPCPPDLIEMSQCLRFFLLTFSSLISGENESDQDHRQQHYHLDRQSLSLRVPLLSSLGRFYKECRHLSLQGTYSKAFRGVWNFG